MLLLHDHGPIIIVCPPFSTPTFGIAKVDMLKLSGVYKNIMHCTAVLFCGPVSPHLDLCQDKCIELRVRDTISSVVC